MLPRNSHDEAASAELAVPLMRNQKPWIQETGSQGAWSTVKAWRWMIDTVLLVVILMVVLWKRDGGERQRRMEVGGDISGLAPQFAQQIVTFKPDLGYAPENTSEFFTDAVHQKWLDLVPRGLGFVKVKDAWKYDHLPTPLPEFSPDVVYTTSMTHQLHCLHSIIEAYSAISSVPGRMPEETPWHLAHCFEYLRQSIMCCGDVALEGKQTTFPEGWTGSDGWDAKHVCRDYSQVYDYLTGSRALNDSWI